MTPIHFQGIHIAASLYRKNGKQESGSLILSLTGEDQVDGQSQLHLLTPYAQPDIVVTNYMGDPASPKVLPLLEKILAFTQGKAEGKDVTQGKASKSTAKGKKNDPMPGVTPGGIQVGKKDLVKLVNLLKRLIPAQ